MAGLFTLGDAVLGVIGSNVLGGPSTGFVEATSTTTGSATGTFGATGSATGTTTSSGSATGTEGNIGTITGTSTTTGTVTGIKATQGTVTGSVTAVGAASGSPDLTGTASGSVASTGSVTGTQPTPEPPTPTPAVTGGGRRHYYGVTNPVRSPQPRPVAAPARSGRARGANVTRSSLQGRCGYVGTTTGTTPTHGHISGDRWPTDDLLRTWRRQAMEADLLALDLL